MKSKKEIKLYNMLLPIWLLWIFPITWLFIIPLTFLTDSAVLMIALKLLKQNEIKKKLKKVILKVWLIGFVADIPGLFMMIITQFVPHSDTGFLNWWYKNNMANVIAFNPFGNIFAFLYVLCAIGITFVLIYFLNLKISLNNIDMNVKVKRRVSLALSVFTTPWLFMFPSGILY